MQISVPCLAKVEEKSFNEDRVRKAIERMNASRGKSNQGEDARLSCVVFSTHAQLSR